MLDNIIHKTNLKLGGLNFDLRLESRKYVFDFFVFFFNTNFDVLGHKTGLVALIVW